MPELPEVENVRRTLQDIVGATIARVDVRLPRIVRRPADPAEFAAALAGRTVLAVGRRGKFLRIATDGPVLVAHMRMEGRFAVCRAKEPEEAHTHVVFALSDGRELRYRDVRQFGTMDLFAPGEEFRLPPLAALGVEPLDPAFTPEALAGMLRKTTVAVKSFLLNQSYVAGIGNIYADESLFAARLHPLRPANSLAPDEVRRLHAAIVATLVHAVDAGGSTVRSYVDGRGTAGSYQHRLCVYGREGLPCPACGRPIEKCRVGGRGTHFCPACQPYS